MFWEEHEKHKEQVLQKKKKNNNNEKKRKLNKIIYLILKKNHEFRIFSNAFLQELFCICSEVVGVYLGEHCSRGSLSLKCQMQTWDR